MSIPSLTSSTPNAIASTDVPLSMDNLTIIFIQVVCQSRQLSYQALFNLRLVCRRWQQLIDSPNLGTMVLGYLGLPIPEIKENEIWHHKTDPRFYWCRTMQAQSFRYPSSGMITGMSASDIMWVEDRGFILYIQGAESLTLCMLSGSSIEIPLPSLGLCAILTIENNIICGLQGGAVTIYSIDNVCFTHNNNTAHQNDIINLFPYQKGFVSICSNKIIYWNENYEPHCLKSDYYLSSTIYDGPYHKADYPFPYVLSSQPVHITHSDLKNDYLFLQYGQTEAISLFYVSISLIDLSTKVTEVIGKFLPPTHHLREVWGGQICQVTSKASNGSNPSLTISLWPFTREDFFKMPSDPSCVDTMTWTHNNSDFSQNRLKCFFRGHVAMIISSTFECSDLYVEILDLVAKRVIFRTTHLSDGCIRFGSLTLVKEKLAYTCPLSREAVILTPSIPK